MPELGIRGSEMQTEVAFVEEGPSATEEEIPTESEEHTGSEVRSDEEDDEVRWAVAGERRMEINFEG